MELKNKSGWIYFFKSYPQIFKSDLHILNLVFTF
jgi:hypothetical protein